MFNYQRNQLTTVISKTNKSYFPRSFVYVSWVHKAFINPNNRLKTMSNRFWTFRSVFAHADSACHYLLTCSLAFNLNVFCHWHHVYSNWNSITVTLRYDILREIFIFELNFASQKWSYCTACCNVSISQLRLLYQPPTHYKLFSKMFTLVDD